MTIENHLPHIARHYAHAKAKHPHFADALGWTNPRIADGALSNARYVIDHDELEGRVMACHLADCELREALAAYAHGDRASAIEECYDTVAVLLRMVDFIEAEQGGEAAK